MIALAAERRPRPDAHRLLLKSLLAMLPSAGVVATTSEPWASATFTGARHRIALTLSCARDAHAFAARAGEIEFSLRGHVVVDLVAYGGEGGGLSIEALTVEDA